MHLTEINCQVSTSPTSGLRDPSMRIQSALGVFHVFQIIYLYGGLWPICAFRQRADTHTKTRQTEGASGRMGEGRELDGTGGSIINAAVRQETRVSPATLFSCHHADALTHLSALQYSLFTLARTIRYDLELDLSIASRQLDLASSRPFARHGPLLPPHRSSHPLQALTVGCDHIVESYGLLQATAAVSTQLSLSGRPDPWAHDEWHSATHAVKGRLTPGSPQDSG